jgi:hypothetical protein
LARIQAKAQCQWQESNHHFHPNASVKTAKSEHFNVAATYTSIHSKEEEHVSFETCDVGLWRCVNILCTRACPIFFLQSLFRPNALCVIPLTSGPLPMPQLHSTHAHVLGAFVLQCRFSRIGSFTTRGGKESISVSPQGRNMVKESDLLRTEHAYVSAVRCGPVQVGSNFVIDYAPKSTTRSKPKWLRTTRIYFYIYILFFINCSALALSHMMLPKTTASDPWTRVKSCHLGKQLFVQRCQREPPAVRPVALCGRSECA